VCALSYSTSLWNEMGLLLADAACGHTVRLLRAVSENSPMSLATVGKMLLRIL